MHICLTSDRIFVAIHVERRRVVRTVTLTLIQESGNIVDNGYHVHTEELHSYTEKRLYYQQTSKRHVRRL